MAKQGTITAFIRRGSGRLVVKLACNFGSLGSDYRAVLTLPDKLELDRGDIIELIWEPGSKSYPHTYWIAAKSDEELRQFIALAEHIPDWSRHLLLAKIELSQRTQVRHTPT